MTSGWLIIVRLVEIAAFLVDSVVGVLYCGIDHAAVLHGLLRASVYQPSACC